MTHSRKTIENQQLTAQNNTRQDHTPQNLTRSRYFAIIPMILLASAFILTACGGSKVTLNANINSPADCAVNPFDTRCTSPEHATARDTRIKECLVGNAVNTPICLTARVAVPCLANPFTDACATDKTFAPYVQTATTERTKFCRMGDNLTDGVCRGATTAICASSGTYANPFDAKICPGEQADNQEDFIDNCNSPDASLRANADCDGLLKGCVLDPFGVGCAADVYAQRRKETLLACNNVGLESSSICAGAVRHCASASASAGCGAITTNYCLGAPDRVITGDISTCSARIATACVTSPLTDICDTPENAPARLNFCRTNTDDDRCTPIIVGFCRSATGTVAFDDALCSGSDYDDARLIQCFAPDFTHTNCASESARSATVTARCGTESSPGSDPFSPVCSALAANPSYATESEIRIGITATQVAFCRTNADSNTNCKATIANFCVIGAADNVFDDLCDGATFAETRLIQCIDPLITHAKCGTDMENITTTATVCGTANVLGTNPFSALCLNADLNPDVAAGALYSTARTRQQAFCRDDRSNNGCAAVIAERCAFGAGAVLFDDSLCNRSEHDGARIVQCFEPLFTHDDCAEDAVVMRDINNICGTEASPGSNPFSMVCSEVVVIALRCSAETTPKPAFCTDLGETADMSAHTLLATQQAFCRVDVNRIGCADTVADYCDVAFDADIFDDLCDGADYLDTRIGQCYVTDFTHADCDGATGIITTHCDSGLGKKRNPACPASDIIHANGAKITDASANLIEGGADKLTLGVDEAVAATEQNPTPEGYTYNEGFKLEGRQSGYGLASANFSGQTQLYAGLLSGRDLGAPVTDNSTDGVWSAELNAIIVRGMPKIVNGARVDGYTSTTINETFSLVVNFADKTIKTAATDAGEFQFNTGLEAITKTEDSSTSTPVLNANGTPVYRKTREGYSIYKNDENAYTDCSSPPSSNGQPLRLCEGGGSPLYAKNDDGVVILDSLGRPIPVTTQITTAAKILIDGRFTSSGTIFGTSNLVFNGGSEIGTLRGLIGTNGAVGTFASDGFGVNAYVGGFVATAGACRAGATPFDKTLCPDTNALAKSLRLRLCIDRHPAAMPFATNCVADSEITDVVCGLDNINSNPLDTLFCPDTSNSSKTVFVDACINAPDRALICTDGAVADCIADPYAPECSEMAYINVRTTHRITCGEAESASETAPLCANFRTFLAGCAVASPDTNACGSLVNTYCLGGAGRTTGGTVTCDSQIVASCDSEPFNARCRDVGITNAARYLMERAEACLGPDSYFTSISLSRSHACNRPDVAASICGTPELPGTDPFNAFCNSPDSNPNLDSLALTREVFCADSIIANRHAMCPTLGTGGSWLADSRNSDNTAKLPILRVPPNQNRRVDGNGLAKVTRLTSYIDRTITPYNHSFISTDISNRGGLRLQGLSTNGFFFVRDHDALGPRSHTAVELVDGVYEIGETTTTLTTDHKLYAGIVPTTNVGARLVRNSVTAEWNGQIQLLRGYDTPDDLTDIRNNANPSDTTPDGYADDAAGTNILHPITGGIKQNAIRNKITEAFASKNFTLLVSFDAAGGVITSQNPIDIADGRMFNINGRFNDKGIIYGTTSYGKDGAVSNGSLTGLIGASGAVGAFISEGYDNPYGIYAGGFVAVPAPTDPEPSVVNYGDWTRSFVSSLHPTIASAITDSDSLAFFLSIADGGTLDKGALVAAIQGNPSNVLTLMREGDDMDGVSYVRGNNGRGNHRILGIVGLLPTTNLGAPFAVSNQTAMWTGSYFNSAVGSSPVTFAIDFSAARTITGTGTGTGAPVFDLGFDAQGVITGTVVSTGVFFATASGLIGAEGLVGGFISPATAHIGGFVAQP